MSGWAVSRNFIKRQTRWAYFRAMLLPTTLCVAAYIVGDDEPKESLEGAAPQGDGKAAAAKPTHWWPIVFRDASPDPKPAPAGSAMAATTTATGSPS